MQMTTQTFRPATEMRLMNHPKTVAGVELLRLRYARGRNIDEARTAKYGAPNLLVLRKIFGAKPSDARPSSVRDARKSTPLPDEKAEVMTTALMIEGSARIPAVWNARTKGEPAVPDAVPIRGSLLFKMRPTTSRDER